MLISLFYRNQRSHGNDWAQNFRAQSCSEITEIATGLSESVTDPKISESKVIFLFLFSKL